MVLIRMPSIHRKTLISRLNLAIGGPITQAVWCRSSEDSRISTLEEKRVLGGALELSLLMEPSASAALPATGMVVAEN